MTKPANSPAIAATLAALAEALGAAAAAAAEASQAASRGEIDLAIGTLLTAQAEIEAAAPLMNASLALHRRRPRRAA